MKYLILAAVAAVLSAGAASASTLVYDNGELIGADSVTVGGMVYNVEFVDGTCLSVFSGCDEASDFFFTSNSQAAAASQSLLDQVLTGTVLDAPSVIRGCDSDNFCVVETLAAYDGSVSGYSTADYSAFSRSAVVFQFGSSTYVGSTGLVPNGANVNANTYTYAVWSEPVPVPPALWLFGSGLLGLVGMARRKKA